MKFSVIILNISAVFIMACNHSSQNKHAAPTAVIKDTALNITTHNSLNSADWQGSYVGTLPCADCEGIETIIVLGKDMTYSLSAKYLGKKKVAAATYNGVFTWSKEGAVITLGNIKNAPAQYLVGENKLFQLDIKGKRITGDNAAKYILTKNN